LIFDPVPCCLPIVLVVVLVLDFGRLLATVALFGLEFSNLRKLWFKIPGFVSR
jgi:hypothetical protein